ncbi:hypothetical protein [Streptomyces sp. NPDC050564]|uniref:hypothetical protein n=1 Tax=Streptomyces sp. NPDC050564 TaxID=3365631 RepID=UPI00379D0B44
MDISARRTVFLSSTALLLCAALTSPALAADERTTPSPSASAPADDTVINTAPPEEPEENVTEVPEEAVTEPAEESPSPGNSPNRPDCSPTTFIYKPTSQGNKYHSGVGPTNANYNGTSRTARSTFTSEVTGSVTVGVSGELDTSINTMIAKIEAKFNINLSLSLTAKLGNSISVDTPSHKTTHARYGVWRLKHTGQSWIVHANCTSTPKHTVVSYSPYRVGWYLWEN